MERARVVAVREAVVWVELTRAIGRQFGPCEVYTAQPVAVGDSVMVGRVEGASDDLVVLGVLTGADSAPPVTAAVGAASAGAIGAGVGIRVRRGAGAGTVTSFAVGTGTAPGGGGEPPPPVTPPGVTFTLSRTDQTVYLDAAESTAGSAPIATWRITWGDGTAAETQAEPDRTALHTYTPPAAGQTYTVTLEATQTDGGKASTTRTIFVPAPSNGGGGTPVGTVVDLVYDPPSASGVNVAATTTGGASARLAISTSSAMTNPVYGPAATPGAGGYVKLSIANLQPNAVYYGALELGGGVYTQRVFKMKTAPPATGGSFAFAFASCDKAATVGTSLIFDRIKARQPHFYACLGDQEYLDNANASEAAYQGMYDNVYRGSRSKPMLAEVGYAYTPSDHDFAPNNGVGTTGTGASVRPFVQSAYRKRVPFGGTLPSPTGGWYRTWTVGRVRFILTDQRSYKSPQGATDNSSKTVLGTEQKAWLKQTITSSPEKLIFIVQEIPWTNFSGADDEWPSYNTERTELANFFKASGKFVEILAGDMHALAYDDGTNGLGIPVMHAAPIHGGTSDKVDAITWGPYPTSGIVEQYGYVEITDTGGSTITRKFTAYDNTNVARYTSSKTYTVAA